jgi:cytochrome P450
VSRLPRERGHWLWGSAAALARAPHTFPAEVGWRHGGIGGFRVLHRRVVALTDPEHARQVLVTRQERYARTFHVRNARVLIGTGLLTTDGDDWLRRRRRALPAFRRDHLSALPRLVADVMARLLDEWEATRRAGKPVALNTTMQRLTITVMARALLSTEPDAADIAAAGQALGDGTLLLRARNTAPIRLPLWLPTDAHRRLKRARDVLDRFVARHLGARAESGNPGAADMLDVLKRARDPDTGAPIAPDELHDEAKTVFASGFETTTQALIWTLYLLAGHPAVAAAWHAELDRVLAGRAPGWAELGHLPVTRAVIDEALRLYPPAYTLPRQCVAADEIAGHAIRPGTIVLVSVFGIHRSAALWPEPERFRPERFAPGAPVPAHAFLPFGMGKHACIGSDLAGAEMLIALALIGQRYRLEPGDDAPVGMLPRITLVPDREIPLRLVPR